jgi:hypothetical protein
MANVEEVIAPKISLFLAVSWLISLLNFIINEFRK